MFKESLLSILIIICIVCQCLWAGQYKKPTVLIALMARNKAYTLPYFLTSLENLDYPKDRISLWLVVFFVSLTFSKSRLVVRT